MHRISLHKSHNMYLVPPMLFPLEGESDADHEAREMAAGDFVVVDFQTVIDEKDPEETKGKNMTLKCITVLEPFAWLIIHGGKDIENRSWNTNYRGPVGIHSGQRLYCSELDILETYGDDVLEASKAQRGHIVGIVDIVDCVTESPSSWFSGPMGWVLENPRPIKPIPYKGSQGFWNANVNVEFIQPSTKQQELF